MLCKPCEDFVDVIDHKCTCCGSEVKRVIETDNKDINTLQKTIEFVQDYITMWEQKGTESYQPTFHIPIGINIRAVRIELLSEFTRTRPNKYDGFLAKLKRESPIVAINIF